MNSKVVNCRDSKYDVFIGRPSKWGNPYTHLPTRTLAKYRVATRKEAIQKYRAYLYESDLINDIAELKDKILGCYCSPLVCHGDILIDELNKLDEPRLF